MSEVRAGIPKSLNIKAQPGSLNALKSSMSTVTRTQGTSYGIMAQRSIFSTGMLQNPKMAYSAGISSTRMMLLNARALKMQMPDMQPRLHHEDNSMNKFMMGMMAMNMVAEMTAGITKGIKDIKAAHADRSEKPTEKSTAKPEEKGKTNVLSSSNTKLEGINTKINDFGNSYKTIADNTKTTINTELSKFASDPIMANFINKLSTDNIKISMINLTATSSLDDIQAGVTTVDNDQTTVDNYKQNIATVSNDIGQKMNELESKLNLPTTSEQEKSLIKEQLTKLTSLKTTINGTIMDQANKLSNDLGAKEKELEGLKEQKKETIKEIKEQAQDTNKQIGKNNEKMTKLKTKIGKEQDDKDKQKLIKEYNELADDNRTLKLSLTQAEGIASTNKFDLSITSINAETTHYSSQ